MAKVNINEMDNYGSDSLCNFFTLKDDGDTAIVRFMYNSAEDIEALSVHRVEVDPVTHKLRYVDCPRSYTDPLEVCPFCAAGMVAQAKIFIPLWDEETETVKIWERGKTFKVRLAKIAGAYPNISQHRFEIERKGAANSKDTTYNIYPLSDEPDGTKVEDLGEIPAIVGKENLVLSKTSEEMGEYLATGHFPYGEGQENVRRDPTAPGGFAGGAVRRGSTPTGNKRPSF